MVQGQEKICNLIDKSTLDTFPRTLMLVGPQGGGKHLICKYIAEKFNLQMMDITDSLDLETIDNIYQRVEPYLYIILANSISVKEENTILKFLEEPLKNSYIILLAETDMGILQTILNRCQIWHLQNYKRDFLAQFLTEDADNAEYILELAQTPGQVQQLTSTNFVEMIELVDKILDKIHIASVSNTLSLSNKIAFKQETDKYDVKLFVRILLSRLSKKYYQPTTDNKLIDAYKLTSELNKNIYVKNLDYKALFENYLISLRSIMRGELL